MDESRLAAVADRPGRPGHPAVLNQADKGALGPALAGPNAPSLEAVRGTHGVTAQVTTGPSGTWREAPGAEGTIGPLSRAG